MKPSCELTNTSKMEIEGLGGARFSTMVSRSPFELKTYRRYILSGSAAFVGIQSTAGNSTYAASQTELDSDVRTAFDKQWSVIVWNDPVNLMSYVVRVFERVLHMNREQATRHMMEVHHQGKSLVAQETRERAEHHVHELQKHGLQATMQPI